MNNWDNLNGMSKKEYRELKETGMFFEWFPTATGDWVKDTAEGADVWFYKLIKNKRKKNG